MVVSSGLGSGIPPARCDQHPLLDRGAPARAPAVAGQGPHTDGLPTQPYLFSVVTTTHTYTRLFFCFFQACVYTGSRRFCKLVCVQVFLSYDPPLDISHKITRLAVTGWFHHAAKLKDTYT